MQIEELRIDNYVGYGVNVVKVKSMHIESVLKNRKDVYIELNTKLPHYCVNLSEVKPIPLTEEILLRLGFNKDYKNGYIGIDSGNVDFVLTEPFVLGEWQNCYEFEFIAGGWPKLKKIEYVHDLQNFFYSLHSEELTFKTN